jgi:hypothetical protein
MEDYSGLIIRCKDNEDDAIIKGAAMGAVILSRMGPIYQKGAVNIFQNLAMQFSKRLNGINSINEFDDYHEQFIAAVHDAIKNQDGSPLSYGEAQKAINVFLKTYVDRSSLPDAETAKRIRPFLHVPLDSVMIKYFKKNFKSDYSKYISPAHQKENEDFKTKNKDFTGKIPDSELSKLAYIYRDVYMAWQKWFRDIFPNKPILLDTIWALERERE